MGYSNSAEDKILDNASLVRQVLAWKMGGKKIVFTNGCFDLLHLGHIDYLNRAADLGDVMVVGLNTDASVRKLKGENRPLQDEKSRLFIMASLACVAAVILFDEPTPLNLIEAIQPDILVKGADYKLDQIIGAKEVLAYGGKVETIPLVQGYSTSAIEARIKGQG
jgi:rfaE bifunctional protein nucleotidyltransferase chain/domain